MVRLLVGLLVRLLVWEGRSGEVGQGRWLSRWSGCWFCCWLGRWLVIGRAIGWAIGCAVGWAIGRAVAWGPFVVAVGQGCWSRPLISGIGWGYLSSGRWSGRCHSQLHAECVWLPIPGKIQ